METNLTLQHAAFCATLALMSASAVAQTAVTLPDNARTEHGTPTGTYQVQEWMPRMELLSAGAAASVVMHHGCIDGNASQQAARRLQTMAELTNDPQTAYKYASNSYDTKERCCITETSHKSKR